MEIGGSDELGARVAGYRLIRRLGRGSHSELYLGHAEDTTHGGERAGAVVVKVIHASTEHDLISDQVAALTGGTASGLPGLVDLATLPDGRVVIVLERLAGPGLATVLGTRSRLDPGEAVTILAPVVVALSSLHERGFAHTTLSQATVRFQADGRAHLTGLGGIRRLTGSSGRHGEAPSAVNGPSRIDLLRDDDRRLAMLMRGVFDRLPPADASTRRAEALLAWFEMAATAVPFQPGLDELERRLFDWSPAVAVRLTEPASAAVVPGRVDAPATVHERGDPPSESAADARAVRGTARAAIRSLLSARKLERDPLRLARNRLRVVAAARRGPLIVLACGVTAVTVLALTLLPPSSTATPRASQGQDAVGAVLSGRAAPDRPAPDRPALDPPVPDPPMPDPQGEIHPMTGAITGDDPVRAADALLAGREGCLAAASVTCLGAFDQPGSAVMEMDNYVIDHGLVSRQGQPRRAGDLLERTGDLALVALQPSGTKGGDSEAASLLLVKGEAGWRLRQVFD